MVGVIKWLLLFIDIDMCICLDVIVWIGNVIFKLIIVRWIIDEWYRMNFIRLEIK